MQRLAVHQDHESSSGGEFHPPALTEPDVRLSPHPAPTPQPRVVRRAASARRGWAPVARSGGASARRPIPDNLIPIFKFTLKYLKCQRVLDVFVRTGTGRT